MGARVTLTVVSGARMLRAILCNQKAHDSERHAGARDVSTLRRALL